MKHPVDVAVGKSIRHRRWLAGLTQQQLGDLVGVKFQQIQKYETGMNRTSASRLWDIAAVLNVPVTSFFDGIEGAAHDDALQAFLTDKEAVSLVQAYYAIPPKTRKSILDMARVLADAEKSAA